MAAPGPIIEELDPQVARRSATATDGWFVAAPSLRGTLGPTELVPGMESKLGDYFPDSQARESVEAFFARGGQYVCFSRVVGAGAEAAEAAAPGPAAAASMTVELLEPGEWGNGCTLAITNGADTTTRRYQVLDSAGHVLEISDQFASVALAAQWAAENSKISRVVPAAGTPPLPAVAANIAFTGGDADLDHIDNDARAAALALMTADFGIGQESLLGVTDPDAHDVLMAHAESVNRIAVCDLDDIHDVATLQASGLAHRDLEVRAQARRGGGFANWTEFPGATSADAPRPLPPSVAVAAQCAFNDLSGVPISQPPAGAWGIVDTAVGLTQPSWSEDDRAALNESSVNVSRNIFGQVRIYGFRSFTDPVADEQWAMLSAGRTAMLIDAIVAQEGEGVEMATIDAKGVRAGTLKTQISNRLKTLRDQGVFYDDGDGGFSVEVGIRVNNVGQVRQRRLQAAVEFTIVGIAEVVRITTTNNLIGG